MVSCAQFSSNLFSSNPIRLGLGQVRLGQVRIGRKQEDEITVDEKWVYLNGSTRCKNGSTRCKQVRVFGQFEVVFVDTWCQSHLGTGAGTKYPQKLALRSVGETFLQATCSLVEPKGRLPLIPGIVVWCCKSKRRGLISDNLKLSNTGLP